MTPREVPVNQKYAKYKACLIMRDNIVGSWSFVNYHAPLHVPVTIFSDEVNTMPEVPSGLVLRVARTYHIFGSNPLPNSLVNDEP